ncbi:sodium ion-translocating decarboxylase subunit beta [Pelotomaculum terephthalicicum JT]|uniref:sodium ion-translocating decarboxylase subunit beta n=1 Tax=Pelotomaculum TaxID=191373 RepID=UPI0009CBED64|nr:MULTISPECIES: sodium ion-translocating decarboxylase subunit beta [Pelotomaculum]MCG9969297.1 sodium ion-translocating decarboxylase subunit beta [Pelotomaculum terephthalicicum JT]OPX88333.1 MAG: Carboxybiotin decarboxylase [Pelotomaculum sp. PtaB.Bin117]OPY62418.1 MAG: Carboxybiotin decarboxylase [Pelotomaculum sp. PtaU1.Bin065]
MGEINVLNLFQGVATLFASEPKIAIARLVLIVLGFLLVYLGYKKILDPLIMLPMGLGMASVNAAVLFIAPEMVAMMPEGSGNMGTIFVAPMVSDPASLINILQIDFLQPIYTYTFSNGLIACLVFMGIGVITDVGYLLARPFASMFIALFAELGSVLTFPVAVACGLTFSEAAAISVVGGADGPMVLFTSLMLAKHLFVPITIVAYLYLSLCYGGYPYLIRFLIPKKLRGIQMDLSSLPTVSSGQKFAFAIIACTVLCLLFPVAAPLFMSFFVGVAVRESGLKHFAELLEGPVLYGSTFFLGLLLGVLCEASTILDPKVLILLFLGVFALFFSGVGGVIGGLLMYFISGKKFNPVVGIAGVSCIPTTSKVAQREVTAANPYAIVLPFAIGCSVSGVITSAILTGVYITLVPLVQ